MIRFKSGIISNSTDGFFSSGLYKQMIIEILFCSIFCPPGLQGSISGRQLAGVYSYSYCELINLLHYFKSYNFLRLYQVNSQIKIALHFI